MKVSLHVIYQIFSTVVSVGALLSPSVPEKAKPYVVLVVSLAQGFVAWYNHYYNPDGTPASVSYKGNQ
jgi:hypothetical protein